MNCSTKPVKILVSACLLGEEGRLADPVMRERFIRRFKA